MQAIYEPRGAAREYSELAVNLYRGCGHGCTYCYAPSCLRMQRCDFSKPSPRKGILQALEIDIAKYAGDHRPVLLCFTCDPYQPIEAKYRLTRQAITMMQGKLSIMVLTKNAPLAMEDIDLFVKAKVNFGQTLLWVTDKLRKQFEPRSSSVSDRIKGFEKAKKNGLQTWMSVEPVIVAKEAIAAIKATKGLVDMYKLGKINHDKQLSEQVLWDDYCEEAIGAVGDADYYIKNDLWAELSDKIKSKYPKERSK